MALSPFETAALIPLCVTDGQLGASQPPPGKFAKERGPDQFDLASACFKGQNLTSPIGFDPNGEDPPAASDPEVDRIDPKVGPIPLQPPVEEGLDPAAPLPLGSDQWRLDGCDLRTGARPGSG